MITPVEIEQQLSQIRTELAKDQLELARRRTAEVEAKIALKRTTIMAFHSPKCPKVTRGGYTVADRDAFIDKWIFQEWETHERAIKAREIAEDKSRTTSKDLDALRTQAASVRQAYQEAGR